ncbi:MAG: hypothetical protein IV086_16305 [Hyphomonadaceae bacterium]|nr:MAG: hypothetical protein FD160_1459 [Caulobacteraceae bacterium]MBT9447263.1 hypothetical protein [Hyphomonadaceae bacterium]
MNDVLARLQAFFAAFGPSEWLAFGSAIAAAWSFLLNRATVQRQERMQFEALRAARDTDLIGWADEVIERLSDAQRLCRDMDDRLIAGDAFLQARSETRTRLSALLDRGRLFFPNTKAEDEAEKAAAFQGKRQKALNAIFAAYRIVSDLTREGGPAPRDAVLALVEEKRLFVSEVFLHIDPRRRRDVITALER